MNDARYTIAGIVVLLGIIVGLMSCSEALARRQANDIERRNPGVTCEVVFSGRGYSPECFEVRP